MGDIAHFEFDAADTERVKNFYENVFGWKITKWEGPMDYWLIDTGGQSAMPPGGGFSRREDRRDFKGMVINTINVENIDKTIEDIKKHGGSVITEKSSIPGIGYLIYFKDTEENIFGAMESDPEAV